MDTTDDSQLTIAAAGDAMVTKRLSTIDDDRFAALTRILTEADASVVNLESPLHDYESFPISRKRTHFRSPPWVADELAWMGFNLFSTTNNHIGDYAQPGMTNTLAELDRRDVSYAGMGETRASARAPAYVETPAGRVALLAATTTFVPGTNAGHQRRDVRGRPGVATLRLQPRYSLTERYLDAIREVRDALNVDELRDDRGGYVSLPDEGDVVPFLDVGADTAGRTLVFEEGDENGIYFEPHPDDVAEIHDAIDVAARNADRVVLSLHSHEGKDGRYNDDSVPPAVETFARGCVDRGVDMFVGHGPHRMRGVEVYEGAPIFYSVGNFVLQYNAIPFFPAEAYETRGFDPDGNPIEIQEEIGGIVSSDESRQSVVPVCTYEDDELSRLRLYPAELGDDRDASTLGTAFLATDDVATDILERLSALSEPYGTEIRVEDGVGTVPLT